MKDGLPRNPPPKTRDRMSGKYFGQCPGCRNGRHVGPDCGGSGPESTRRRRKVENAAVRRYTAVAAAEEAYAEDAENDPGDCRHGCNGDCVTNGDTRCNFTCHQGDIMRTDSSRLAETAQLANSLLGETPGGFYQRLPGACPWVNSLPETSHVEMAQECAKAQDVPALVRVLTEWRHIADVFADPETLKKILRGHNHDQWFRVSVDREANAMYVRLRDGGVHRTVEVAPWLLVDVDESADPVGVELLSLDLRETEV